ncbi:MAG: hypothetical protein MH321_08530 [Leptospiraceae bacterium]|nr:hypothetical protein [Leptospiraceae bacterium]
MKKLIFFLTLFQVTFSCILFKESELDPKSELGKLFTLYKIFEFNRGYEWKWDYKFIDPANIGNTTIHRVTKLNRDIELRNTLTEIQDGVHIGTFTSNFDAVSEIYFPELGRFQIDNYNTNQTYVSSIVIDIFSSNDRSVNILRSNIPSNYSEEALSVQRIPKRTHEPYLYFEGGELHPGLVNGRYFFFYLICFSRDLFLSSTEFKIRYYPILTSTVDGETWETIELTNLIVDRSNASPKQISLGKPFLIADTIYLPTSINDPSALKQYNLVKIPTSNPKNLEYLKIAPRNADFREINLNKMFIIQNQLVYEELNSPTSVPNNFYRDSNLLQAGSSNASLPTGNALTYGNFPIFFDTFTLVSDGTSTYKTLDSSFNDNTNSFSHTASLGGIGGNGIFGDISRQLLFESDGTTSYRVSNLTNSINSVASNALSFSGNLVSGTIPPSSSASLQGFVKDSNNFYFSIRVDNKAFQYELNNQTLALRTLNDPPAIFPNPSFIEDACLLGKQYNKNQMVIGNGRYICIKSPKRRLIAPPNTTYSDNRKFVSTSSDGINWKDWKEFQLNPQIRK